MLFLIFPAIHALLVNADCYSRDGILARDSVFYTGPELVSCGNGTNNCCIEDQKCGSNLLCAGSDGHIARQYCAEKDWTGCSAMCPGYQHAGVSLVNCGNNNFCCPSDGEDCCSNGKASFVDPINGEVKALSEQTSVVSPTFWVVDTTALLAGSSTSKLPSLTSSQVATSAAGTTASAFTEKTTSDTATSTTVTATSTSGPSASQEDTSSSSSNTLSAGAGAGIGIGSAAAVVGIATLVWLFFRERKKRQSLQAQLGSNKTLQYAHAEDFQPPTYVEADAYKEPSELIHEDTSRRQELEGEVRPDVRHEMS